MTLKERILKYCKARPHHPVPSGEIQRLVTQHTKYSASNATRRLRELENEGELSVGYEKGHAIYTFIPPKTQRKWVVEIVNGVAVGGYQLLAN